MQTITKSGRPVGSKNRKKGIINAEKLGIYQDDLSKHTNYKLSLQEKVSKLKDEDLFDFSFDQVLNLYTLNMTQFAPKVTKWLGNRWKFTNSPRNKGDWNDNGVSKESKVTFSTIIKSHGRACQTRKHEGVGLCWSFINMLDRTIKVYDLPYAVYVDIESEQGTSMHLPSELAAMNVYTEKALTSNQTMLTKMEKYRRFDLEYLAMHDPN